MSVPDTSVFRSSLEGIIFRHATQPVSLLIVNRIEPLFVIAQAGKYGQGAWAIQLCRQLDPDQIKNIYEVLELRRFSRARQVLNSPEKFLGHTVLHELAHLENGWGNDQDAECDGWAFEKMGLEAN